MPVFNFFCQKITVKFIDHAFSEHINRFLDLDSVIYISIIIGWLLFCFLMSLVCLFSWTDDFLSVIVKQPVCSLILQSFYGFVVSMFSGLLLVSMFSGLLLLSDVSEITVLILAVLLLVFCHSLCFDHLLKVFCAIRGIISLFLETVFNELIFLFYIFSQEINLT